MGQQKNKTNNNRRGASELQRLLGVIKNFARAWIYPITAIILFMQAGKIDTNNVWFDFIIGAILVFAGLKLLRISDFKEDVEKRIIVEYRKE